MAIKSPLARVKEEFGGKDKLVDKIVGLLGSESEGESKDDLRRRLLGAANSKLVRLHGAATQLKELGGRDQLATAAATEMGHGKDKDFVEKLSSYSTGRLVDLLSSARRRKQLAAAKVARKAQATARAAAKKAAPATTTPATKAKPKAEATSARRA
jgi:hypothetical protein